jgi:hypothetical protein
MRRSSELSPQQRSLLEIMREHQFGRIENMSIRAGQPVLDQDLKVVRVASLGGESGGTKPPAGDEFELKRVVCDLFDELARLGHGTVVKLEFKRGLPCRLETTPCVTPSACGTTEPQVLGSLITRSLKRAKSSSWPGVRSTSRPDTFLQTTSDILEFLLDTKRRTIHFYRTRQNHRAATKPAAKTFGVTGADAHVVATGPILDTYDSESGSLLPMARWARTGTEKILHRPP